MSSFIRLKSVLHSAGQAEEDIGQKFGSRLRISGHNRSNYRLLIDGIQAESMSVSGVFTRWGERDDFIERSSHINIKLIGRGRFDVIADEGRYELKSGMGIVCSSERIAGYVTGEATEARTILIDDAVFRGVLTDHLGERAPIDWARANVFRMETRIGALVRSALFVIDENFDTDERCIYSETSLRLTRDALIVAIGECMARGRAALDEQLRLAGSKALARDAIDFVRASLDPLSIHDVATALGVGVRALQGAFRKHVGASPAFVLRMARLDGAHRDLESGLTATAHDAARKWGFSNAGRFSSEYYERIGEFPSETIARRLSG